MVKQHDGVLGQLDLVADVLLAEVLVAAVADAGDRVQPEVVLGWREEVVAVAARPAVAVTHVDHDRCVLQGGLDPRPGRVGRDHGDVGRVPPGDPGGLVGLRAEAVGHAGPDRADDDDDFAGALRRRRRERKFPPPITPRKRQASRRFTTGWHNPCSMAWRA